MSLESKSQELKKLVSTFDTQWFLGDLSSQMKNIAEGRGDDEIGKLSSPMRQLYFLGGLLMTTDPAGGDDNMFTHEKWNQIVDLLNEIEQEYDKLFFPKPDEEITEEWKKIRKVAMPSFLAYFNQGPLNYEEQVINWVRDLYCPLDEIIKEKTGLVTEDFISFYNSVDALVQKKFQGFSIQKFGFDPEWLQYTKIQMGFADDAPEFIRQEGEKNRPLYTFMADHGIINRFYAKDIAADNLSINKVNKILSFLTCKRAATNFLYYTATNPGNPLYQYPIVDIGEAMYQVFEVKQVIHAIEDFLESTCSDTKEKTTKLVERKGKLLEDRIVELFKKLFKKDYKLYQGYYVDGCEQDILFLWENYAFIIEAKGYNLREPLRDPNRAFIRIKDDFKSSIGYGYLQTKRVERKFKDQLPLRIEDKNGNLIEEINTTQYKDNDFSIIVNLKSFGQIQNDLSTLLEIEDDDVYPWAVRLDDLEIFILTLLAQKRSPKSFIDFLILREDIHGKLICIDESEVMGAFLEGSLDKKVIEEHDIIQTVPDLADVFDKQYNKGMGFKNEKLWNEKKSGKYLFW